MTKGGRPERIYVFGTGLLALLGLACFALGYFCDEPWLTRTAWWLAVPSIGLAFLPLAMVVALTIVERLRK